jgi:hypothetical protein
MDRAEQQVIESGSRLDRTDAEAMEDVDAARGAVAGALASGGEPGEAVTGAGLPQGAAAKAAAEAPAGRFEALVQGYVDQGLITKADGQKRIEQARHNTALARANNMVISSPKSLLALSDQEQTTEGSTFLHMLDPITRARVTEAAHNRQQALENEAYTAQERARRETERTEAATNADVKREIALRMNKGTATQDYLDTALQLRHLTDDEYRQYSAILRGEEIQGGVTDPATVKRLSVEIYNSSIPASTRLANLTAAWKSGKVPMQFYQTYAGELAVKADAEALNRVNPVLAKKTTDAQQQVRTVLQASNILGNGLDDSKNAEIGRVSRMLDENQYSQKPEDPQAILDRELPGSMARISSGTVTLGQSRSAAARAALGMPPRESITKNQASITAKKADLARQYQAATTQAERSRIQSLARELNDLDAIERAIDEHESREQIITRNAPQTPGAAAKRTR